MNKRQRKYFGKAAILAMVAASIPFTACSYLDSLLPHDPSDDDPIQISSSSKAKSSSSVATPSGEFQTWYGYNGEPQIQTGLANDTETAGYWYSFSDEMDGGHSKILWPVEPGNEYSNEAMDPIINHCSGLCGTYVLDKGSLMYKPYVGVGFNLVGEKSFDDSSAEVGDASSMSGVCVTYASDIPISAEMRLGEEMDASIDYAVPAVLLPKSSGTTKRIAWQDFKQPAWYKGQPISGEEAAAHLAAITFKFQGESGSTGTFNIAAVGPYDGCEASQFPIFRPTTQVNPPDPIDPPNPIDPPPTTNDFTTWFGLDGIEQIHTGYDVGTETSGYWFYYGDDIDGGKSRIIWPELLGNEYNPESLLPVIEHCGGVCGTAILDQGDLYYQPFVGIGFNLAGDNNDGNIATADAAGMGGICITYSSDAAPTLEMSLGDHLDATLEYALPAVSLPKSPSGTTRFIPWSSFKQPSWYKGNTSYTGEQASRTLAALRFKIQASAGKYNFNIQEIGPYNGGVCGVTAAAITNKVKNR